MLMLNNPPNFALHRPNLPCSLRVVCKIPNVHALEQLACSLVCGCLRISVVGFSSPVDQLWHSPFRIISHTICAFPGLS